MSNADIPGAKPRYLEIEERKSKLGIKFRNESYLEVRDINSDGSKKKYMYKRAVDPLDPVY